VLGVAFTGNSRSILAGTRQEVKAWRFPSGRLSQEMVWRGIPQVFLGFSPDGSRAATSDPGRVVLWDLATGKRRSLRSEGSELIQAAGFSSDGRLLATGGKFLSVWEATTGTLHQALGLSGERPVSVALSADGSLLACGTEDGLVDLWDLSTGTLRCTLRGHRSGVRCVAFSPNGRLLATASRELVGGQARGDIRVWDTGTAALRRRLEGHTDTVSALAFSPDGTWLATGSYDTTVRLWKVA
jgi:WD40 repeat protein